MSIFNFILNCRTHAAVICIGLLVGCAVTTQDVADEAQRKTAAITSAQAKVRALPKAPEPLKRIQGNYIGGQPMAISHSLALPPSAREVVINFGPSHGSLSDVARNINRATGIPVRIDSDVPARRPQAEPRQAAPIPAGPMPVGSQVPRVPMGDLPLYFVGDLSDYLNRIASMLDVSWQYGNGEVHVFRRVTRVFSLMVSPGSLAVRDDINTTGQNSGGGSAHAQQAGSFGSNSNGSTNSTYNPWEANDHVLKTMVSAEGKYTVNQSSGTVVVTDAKENVDRIAEWVRQENATLTRQVAIEVRESRSNCATTARSAST
jgi:hypothetical protein